jgi:hypothetical protein
MKIIHVDSNKICLENGSLLKTNAGTIVNSTSPDLSLNCGALSKLILNSCGLTILDECRRFYPNGIKVNEVAVTSAGVLSKFSNIFHVTLTQFQDVNSCSQVCLLNFKLFYISKNFNKNKNR